MMIVLCAIGLLASAAFQLTAAQQQQQWTPIQTVQIQHRPQQQSQDQWPSDQIGQCYDTAVNCLENSYFCSQPYYQPVMRQQCARTCQFCQSLEPTFDSFSCRDINPECRMWARNGFCESLFYPEHIKRRYCAFSCGYCRPAPLGGERQQFMRDDEHEQTRDRGDRADEEAREDGARRNKNRDDEEGEERERPTTRRIHRTRVEERVRVRTNEPIVDEEELAATTTARPSRDSRRRAQEAREEEEEEASTTTTTTEKPE